MLWLLPRLLRPHEDLEWGAASCFGATAGRLSGKGVETLQMQKRAAAGGSTMASQSRT